MDHLDVLDASKEFGSAINDVLSYVTQFEESDYFKERLYQEDVKEKDFEKIMKWYRGDNQGWETAPWKLLKKYPHVWVDAYWLEYRIDKARSEL